MSEIATLTDFQIDDLYFKPAEERAKDQDRQESGSSSGEKPVKAGFLEADGSLLPKPEWVLTHGAHARTMGADPEVLYDQIAAKLQATKGD